MTPSFPTRRSSDLPEPCWPSHMGASHVAATGYHRRLGLRRCRNLGTKGKDIMAVTRSAAKTAAARSAAKPVRDGVTLQMFLWEGTDKRGKKIDRKSTRMNSSQ